MVGVPVRDDQVVDGLEAGRRVAALWMRSASRGAGVAAVDQHRLAGRRDDQRRGAALGVDEVDLQAWLVVGRQDGPTHDPASTRSSPPNFLMAMFSASH